MDQKITALDADILTGLAAFTYCTNPQLSRITGAKEESIKHALRRLRLAGRPLIKRNDYGFLPGMGKLHSVYTLTAGGVNVLAEIERRDPADYYFPSQGTQYSRDYMHRRAFVDCHIAVVAWARAAGAEIGFFHRYFVAHGGNHTGSASNPANPADTLIRREYETRVILPTGELIIPDGIFSFGQGEKTRLCVLEIHGGKETKKIMNQLMTHIRTMESAVIRKKYGLEEPHFVLSVYEHAATMEAVMKRFKALPDYPKLRLAFHFASVAEVMADIRTAWRVGDGEKVTLFR